MISLTPRNLHIDIKIIVLGDLEQELQLLFYIGDHHGGHLEY